MKKYALLLIILSLVLCFNTVHAGSGDPADTVISYFEACKKGDVETMKKLIAGPFYDSKIVLLSKNKGYPQYLRKYYKDINIIIGTTHLGNLGMLANEHPRLYEKHFRKQIIDEENTINEIAVVIVTHKFSSGSTFETKLLLKRDDSNEWKIYDEILAN